MDGLRASGRRAAASAAPSALGEHSVSGARSANASASEEASSTTSRSYGGRTTRATAARPSSANSNTSAGTSSSRSSAETERSSISSVSSAQGTESESSREGLPPHSLRDIHAEITRCICGYQDIQSEDEFDDDGLYVQCDRCSVWQHGFCVGLRHERDVPEHYFCELCRPDLHAVFQRGRHPKQSRYNKNAQISEQEKINSNASRKRSTMNSRNMEFDQGNFSNLEPADHSLSSQHQQAKKMSISTAEARKGRKLRPSDNVRQRKNVTAPPAKKRKSKDNHTPSEDDTADSNHINKSHRDAKASSSPTHSIGSNDKSSVQEAELRAFADHGELSMANDLESKRTLTGNGQRRNGRRTRGASSTSANQAIMDRSARLQKNDTGFKSPHDDSITLDKPSRPRLPQSRTTMGEMHRRVAAMLEYIGRIQVELLQEQQVKLKLSEAIAQTQQKSLSIAANSRDLDLLKFESLEMMENLTKKLLNWEEKFGKSAEHANL